MTSEDEFPPLTNHFASESNPTWSEYPACDCLDLPENARGWKELPLHQDVQDESAPAWLHLLELIEDAAADGREEFVPLREMTPQQKMTIVTLPPTIAKLKQVKHFSLYGSNLSRIPPEIGQMTSLEMFTPYTSYRLHWFPYEIRRCTKLHDSVISTRALYGNYKHRPPFPALPQPSELYRPPTCSVCDSALPENSIQCWTSLRIGSDVVPLLVHACSQHCIDQIEDAPPAYITRPHQGGLGLEQPKARG